MKSVIFRSAVRLIHPLLLILSLWLLFKGHNEPGGGFVGGLLAAGAFALYVMGDASGTARAKLELGLKLDPRLLIALGLLLALFSGIPGMILHGDYMRGVWIKAPIPALGPTDIGSPMFFDLGVYCVVLGVSLKVILSMAEEHA